MATKKPNTKSKPKKSSVRKTNHKKKINKRTQVSKSVQFKQFIKSHKLVSIFVFVLLIIIGLFAYNKALDWQNRRDIHTFDKEVTRLMEAVADQTGNEDNIRRACVANGGIGPYGASGGGVNCGYVSSSGIATEFDDIESIISGASDRSISKFEGRSIVRVNFDDDTSCTIAYKSFFISCLIKVRGGNEGFARNLFSEDN